MSESTDLSIEQITELLPYATGKEKTQLIKLLELKTALLSPMDYAAYAAPDEAVRYPHSELISRYLVALMNHALYEDGIGLPAVWIDEGDGGGHWEHPHTGEIPKRGLGLSMPPRHGKSWMVSRFFPAWILTKWPTMRVILASYEADFAATWGQAVRDLIDAHPEFGVFLDPNSKSRSLWNIKDHGGGMTTAGAGGPITGKGGVVIMDDLIKNSVEANSETKQKELEDWWHSTARTRREPYGVYLMMFTRWSENDLMAYVKRTEGKFWYFLNVPALAFGPEDGADPTPEGYATDPDTGLPDPLHRQPGQALCPPRYTRADLLEFKESGDPDDPYSGGEAWFNALFQGRPTSKGTGIFQEPFYHYDLSDGTYTLHLKSGDTYRFPVTKARRFVTVDTADSVKTTADWTVYALWDVSPQKHLILRDLLRIRTESINHQEKLVQFLLPYTTGSNEPMIMYIGVEKKTFGTRLIQDLVRSSRWAVKPINADTDKVTRAIPAGLDNANGLLFLPKDRPWLKAYKEELLKFDKGRWDDQVDVTAYAVLEAHLLAVLPDAPPRDDYSAEARNARRLERLRKGGKKRPGMRLSR